jgi:transcription-repair coupling factor (superfamily II helicase)
VDLPLAAFIPEEYVSDLNTRLSLYMRLARMTSVEDTAQFRAELCDRFGPVPLEFDDLLYMVRVKLLGTAAGVQEVYVESGQVVVKLGPWAPLDRESLARRFGPDVRVGKTQLRLNTEVLGDRWQSILEQVLEGLQAAISAR